MPKFNREHCYCTFYKRSYNSMSMTNFLPPTSLGNIIITNVMLWIIDEIRYTSNRNIKINAKSQYRTPVKSLMDMIFCISCPATCNKLLHLQIEKHSRFSWNFVVSTRLIYILTMRMCIEALWSKKKCFSTPINNRSRC